MTLKSFYSCNHRLPLTWIRAVTPAPACLPPRLPKLPAGRRTGKLPNYCQGGQGKERTWWERLRKTDWKTEIQKEKGTQPPATKNRHRLKPSQLRYAQVHVHTFTIHIHHFGSISHSQIYKHIQTHRYTRIINIHSTKFQAYVTQNTQIPRFIGTNKCNADTHNS